MGWLVVVVMGVEVVVMAQGGYAKADRQGERDIIRQRGRATGGCTFRMCVEASKR